MGQRKAPKGVIRKLWPTERDAFVAHLLRLDGETRRNRFGMSVSDDFLHSYAETTFGIGGIVFGYVEEGAVRGAAELRGLDNVASDAAEAAFSVEHDWRRKGIGAALFHSLITAARNRGHGRLFMTCLRTNAAMQAMARKFSAELAVEIDDVQGILDAGKATPFTILEEAMEDANGFSTLALDVQRRFWGRAMLRRAGLAA